MGNQPWSPAQAEQKLSELVDHLDDSVTNIRSVSLTRAEAEHAFKLGEAREFTRIRATGVAQEEAKRRALLATADEHHSFLIAESVERASYTHISVLKAQCDALRSLLVSARGVSS